MTDEASLKKIVEAALLAAGRPLNLDQLQSLFPEREEPDKKQLRQVLAELTDDYQGRGIEVTEVGSGFRIQVRAEFSPWVSKLWAERPPKYSRALLETLALIAYRQPLTRGEIEDVRGVSVSTNIIKTLTEREWVRVVGHRDVPGKPALYATTKEFLDYFNLKSLNELPTLAEIRDLDSINRELELVDPEKQDTQGEAEAVAEPEAEVELEAEAEAEAEQDLDEDPEGLASVEGEDTIPIHDEPSGEEPVEEDASATARDETAPEERMNQTDSEDEPPSKPAAHESE
ncbi:MAG: SMC-Scp complex subunit ScpB [gamma proteobacterium symbiont of Ctena orbiculata]|nr:MAG: SMC-Scp complex subunit ScpB [gamma proteobacterium symbiont of Ctena orbiculata]